MMVQKQTYTKRKGDGNRKDKTTRDDELKILEDSFVTMINNLSNFLSAAEKVNGIMTIIDNGGERLRENEGVNSQEKLEDENTSNDLGYSYTIMLDSLISLRTSMTYSLPIIDDLLSSLFIGE